MKRFWDSLKKAKWWVLFGIIWTLFGLFAAFFSRESHPSSSKESIILLTSVWVMFFPGGLAAGLVGNFIVKHYGLTEQSIYLSYIPSFLIGAIIGAFQGYIFYLIFAGSKKIKEKLRSRNGN